MALTQEQVDWWFSQNPDATPEDVAAAVKSVGGLEGNAGLAGMIANRFSIAEPEVTNYYNAYTAPKTPAATTLTTPTTDTSTTLTTPTTDTSTVLDNIINTPTTQADLLSTLAAPADNITNNGYVNPSTRLNQQYGVEVRPIEGDDIETQAAQLAEEYASWSRSADGRFMNFIRKDDGAILKQTPYTPGLSNSQLLKIGLSFVPGAAPFVAAYNALDAARRGDIVGAVIGGTGLVPGMENLNTALKVGQAIDQNNPFGAVTTLAGNADLQKLVGFDTANLGGFTAKDVMAAGSLAQAASSNNTAGVLTSLGTLTGSSDTVLAGKALALYTRLQNGDTRALTDAINLSNSVSGSTTGATTGSTTGSNITTLTDEDLAELQPGELNAYQNGGVQGLADFRRDMRLLTGLTTSGRTGDDTGGDTTLFTNSLGALDQLDTTRTADEYADFLASIGITNTTQLTDSGLSNQDILDLINAGTDTVTVTDTTDKNVVTDTTTGTTTNTKTGLTCAKGFTPNEAGTECIAVLEVEACKDGKVRDPVTGQCVLPATTTDTTTDGTKTTDLGTVTVEACKDGKVRDPITGQCVFPEEIPTVVVEACKDGKVRDPITGECVMPEVIVEECKDGKVRDPITGECVLPDEETPCPEGYSRDEATGKCIPVVTIVDKKCPTGQIYDEELKKCVPIKTEECATGFHKDATGLCVPDDDDECKTGYEKVDGKCVPVCKEGYIRNLATGVCEKEDKACPAGQVKNAEGKCVPIVITPPVTCQPGYEKVDGVCVPVCKTGYKRVNGVCKKIATETATPSTSALNAEGEKIDPIYAGAMGDFDLFATLEELLKENPEPKKDSKKSKDKTKMATGGHLDDLLAEQMTVDDLLKLLR